MYFLALVKNKFFLYYLIKCIVNFFFPPKVNYAEHSQMCVNYYVFLIYEMPACTHSVQDAKEAESRP